MSAPDPSPLLSALVAHARAARLPAAAAVPAVAAAMAERVGVVLEPAPPALVAGTDRGLRALVLDAPADESVPDVLGQLHEALLDRVHRRRRGVFYTPPAIAAGVVDLLAWPGPVPGGAGAAGTPPLPTVCDPAVGGGAFLLAAARRLADLGHRPADIVARGLWGVDVDPVAVGVARATLALWAATAEPAPVEPATAEPAPVEPATAQPAPVEPDRARDADGPPAQVVVGDSLLDGPAVWGAAPAPPGGFDVVVGNPPFQSQLGRTTSRPTGGEAAAVLRRRFGATAFRYTDSAALFLLEACRWARPGGQVALVLPQSVLVAADARALREAVLELGSLERLWLAEEDVFAAAVRVCVPVVRRGAGGNGAVEIRRGPGFTAAGTVPVDADALRAAPGWGRLRAAPGAVPPVDLRGDGDRLGAWCAATAGFRDQFYGLAPFVVEAEDGDDPRPKLVTCGLLDPARLRWGSASTRFAGRQWRTPVVDLDRLRAEGPPALAAWAHDRLVPKVVVATQTRVLEAAVDERGRWFPSVPTIAVTPAVTPAARAGPTGAGPTGGAGPADPAASGLDGDPWRVAAVVLAPPVSAWALARHGGAALSDDALRVSARQLLDAPLPPPGADWDTAVRHLAEAAACDGEAAWRAAMHAFGAVMCAAYGVDGGVLDWWHRRLPAWR